MDNDNINTFMSAAILQARLAKDRGEVPVGAIIVRDGRIIAGGHNLCEIQHNPTMHAEIISINHALKKLGKGRLDDCDMYVTLEPCAMCCGAIAHARMRRLYFGAYDKRAGAVVSNFNMFDSPSPLKSGLKEYYCGIMEDECSALLTDFFKKIR